MSDPEPVVVVRLRTTFWGDKKGLHMRKELTYLRRRSQGFNWMEEDECMGGAEQVFRRIINLESCEDGVYEVEMCNLQRDFDSGYVDSWDYRLVPFVAEEALAALKVPECPRSEDTRGVDMQAILVRHGVPQVRG